MPDDTPTLSYSPFPVLRWEEPFWVGTVTLTSWQGFQPAFESDGTRRRLKKAAGPAELMIVLPDELIDDGIRPLPSPEQAAAFGHLLGAEAAIQTAVLRAVLKSYPDFRDSIDLCADDDDEEEELRAKLVPAVRKPADFAPLTGLKVLHVLPASKSDFAYVGFEFDCTWDGEHGLGVLTHKGRVIKVGGADVAFDTDTAQKDARKSKSR